MSEGDSPMTDAEVEAVARAIAGAAGLPIVPQCECRTSARAAIAALDAARAVAMSNEEAPIGMQPSDIDLPWSVFSPIMGALRVFTNDHTYSLGIIRVIAPTIAAALDAARASEAWRYEIQHGPDGEAAYAWLYRGDEMVGTMRTHHAAAICAARGTVTAAEVERLARVACEAFGFEPIEGIQVRTVWADMVRAILRAQGRKLEGE